MNMDVSGWHSLPICGNKIMNEYCLLSALSLSMFDCAVSGHSHEIYAPVCVCILAAYIPCRSNYFCIDVCILYILCVRGCLLNKTDHRCPHKICIQIFSGTQTKLLTFWHTEKKITTILCNPFPNSLCLLPLWVKC